MAYVDSQWNTTVQVPAVGFPTQGVSLGTITTNGTATYTGTLGTNVNGTFRFPVWKDAKNILGIRVYTTVAPGAGVTALVATFLNGTGTVGTATLSTTVGYVDAALTTLTLSSNGVPSTDPTYFTSTTSNEMTMNLVGVGTASGSALGSYAIDVIWRNLFTV